MSPCLCAYVRLNTSHVITLVLFHEDQCNACVVRMFYRKDQYDVCVLLWGSMCSLWISIWCTCSFVKINIMHMPILVFSCKNHWVHVIACVFSRSVIICSPPSPLPSVFLGGLTSLAHAHACIFWWGSMVLVSCVHGCVLPSILYMFLFYIFIFIPLVMFLPDYTVYLDAYTHEDVFVSVL